MYKTTTTYKVGPKTHLDKIFPNGLPINAFIDKGRCGIGAFREEMKDKSRCTLMTAPNISILLNKKRSNPDLDIVYANVSNQEIATILSTYKPGHKIMSTPEGIHRIMKIAEKKHRLREFYKEWFFLLDEAHTFISENYRKDILCPFNYFWKFDKKSIISATPYSFTDPRFKQLDHYKIIFKESLGEVILVNSNSVDGTLDYVLKHLEHYPGNLHVFYNSVTAIKNAIIRAGLKECNIFCANDEKGKNMKTLGDLTMHWVEEPTTHEYKKVNFYTSKYFEGWDLEDSNATLILVTDVYKPHTLVGAKSKGKQAFGRLREPAYQFIHITNHKHTKHMKSLEAFRQEYLYEANYLIEQNNTRAADFSQQGIAFTADQRLNYFADIEEKTNIATINLMKLDQQINEAANNEIYNSIDYIEQDWNDAYFDVKTELSNVKLETNTKLKRKSASQQLKDDYEKLRDYRLKQQNGLVISLFGSTEQDVQDSNPTAYLADKYLDEATMIKLKYNMKKVEAAIILKENSLTEVKLLRLIGQIFQIGKFYTNEYIKSKLQDIYDKLSIREENGKIKVANANQLGDNGRFEIYDTKQKNSKGKLEHGKMIVRAQFGLRMAA